MSADDGFIHATVENENATISYWYKGKGPLLILIPGGGGHGAQYNELLPRLANDYMTATFDRRQGVPCNPAQGARDIIAIVKSLGHGRTSVFAHSGGGISALQLAVSYPQHLNDLILHEVPTFTLLPEPLSTASLDFSFAVLSIYHSSGPLAAMRHFATSLVGIPPSFFAAKQNQLTNPADLDNFFKFDFLVFGLWCPDFVKIRENGVSVGIGRGKASGEAPYAVVTEVQKERLGLEVPVAMFPGHHMAFEDQAGEFASVVRRELGRLEDERLRKNEMQKEEWLSGYEP